jgi:hypothetical protein
MKSCPGFFQVLGLTRLRILPDMKDRKEQRIGSLPI